MFTFHPRSTWNHLSPYPVNGPAVDWSAIDTAVIHYTAADDLIDGDPGEHASELPKYLADIQTAYAKPKAQGGRGYSIGYMFAVDWLGGVWQLRGWEFRSAANAGHNEHTMPILMLVDAADPATTHAIGATRQLITAGQVRAGRKLRIVGHGDLSGAATACPGAGLRAQVRAGVFTPPVAPEPAPPPPPPPPPEVPEVFLYRDTRYAEVYLVGAGPAVNVGPATFKHLSEVEKLPLILDEHDGMLRSLLEQAGVSIPTPVS